MGSNLTYRTLRQLPTPGARGLPSFLRWLQKTGGLIASSGEGPEIDLQMGRAERFPFCLRMVEQQVSSLVELHTFWSLHGFHNWLRLPIAVLLMMEVGDSPLISGIIACRNGCRGRATSSGAHSTWISPTAIEDDRQSFGSLKYSASLGFTWKYARTAVAVPEHQRHLLVATS